MFDVFGLGACALDRLAPVDDYPPVDQKLLVDEVVDQCGGVVATALVALARWGRSCALSAVLGDDPEGEILRADLEREGVDTSGLLVRPGHRSQAAFITAERETGRRNIFWWRPTGPAPRPDELPPLEARVFLGDGLYAEASVAAAQRAGRVVVDAGSVREGTLALLPHADVVLASERFARDYAGADDPEGACRKLRELGVKVAGVTLGERGYVAAYGNTLVRRPAYEVDAVDTTGCGDIFHAGYVHGMLSGWPPERCLDFGAWAAGQAATALGGRAGIPALATFPPGFV